MTDQAPLPSSFSGVEIDHLCKILLSTAGLGILQADSTGKIVFASQAAHDLFQYANDDLLGVNYQSLFRPRPNILEEDAPAPQFSERVTAIKSSGEPMRCQLTASVCKVHNEKRIWLIVSGTQININDAEKGIVKSPIGPAMDEAMWEMDFEQDIISWDSGFSHLFGHAAGVYTLHAWDNFMHPEDRSAIMFSFERTVQRSAATEWQSDFRLRKADGNYAFVSLRGRVKRLENGQPKLMTGIIRDISHQRYQEQLAAFELSMYQYASTPGLQFLQLCSNLLEGVERLHPDMRCCIVLNNDASGRHEIISNRLPDTFIHALNEKIAEVDSNAYFGSFLPNEDPLGPLYLKLSREHNLYACWSIPLLHSNGNVLGSLALFYGDPQSPTSKEWNTILRVYNLLRLLTENHHYVSQIREAVDRFNIVIEATHDSVWDWDLESEKIHRDTLGIQSVFGLDRPEHIASIEQWISRIHSEDADAARGYINELLESQTQKTFSLEYRFRRDDGEYNVIFDRAYVLHRPDGSPYRVIGTAQNITARKELEEELLQEKLQRQKEITQTMIDTQEQERLEIGKELHDNVNQLLTTTKLYLELAIDKKDMAEELIQKSSENILNAINSIRDLTQSLVPPSFDDLGLIDSLDDLIENCNLSGKTSFSFEQNIIDESLLEENKKLMLLRIIQEACTNILKHAQAEEANILMLIKDQELTISVRDNGRGFVYNPHRSGIGLANIKNRVSLLNGSFLIISSPGNGTELQIAIPLLTKIA